MNVGGAQFAVSERRACEVLGQPRSSQRYQGRPRDDEPARIKRMLELVRKRPRFGYRRIGRLLKAEGWRVGLARMFRLKSLCWSVSGLFEEGQYVSRPAHFRRVVTRRPITRFNLPMFEHFHHRYVRCLKALITLGVAIGITWRVVASGEIDDHPPAGKVTPAAAQRGAIPGARFQILAEADPTGGPVPSYAFLLDVTTGDSWLLLRKDPDYVWTPIQRSAPVPKDRNR